MLSINGPFQTCLQGWHLEDALQRYPVVPLAESSFTRPACLEVNIRNMDVKVRGTARGNLRRFIVSLDGLPRVCHILTAFRDTSELEILAKFVEVKANTLDSIMDCLEEACGFGSVVVEGLDAPATKQVITKLMMPESSTQEEILERTNGHKARILEHIDGGRYVQAMKACQDGMAYIEFICKSADIGRLNPLFNMLSTLRNFTKMALTHAWLCLKCCDYQSARHIMSLLLGSDPHASLYRGNLSMRSKGHVYYGMSLVAGGANNAAAFSFFRALALTHTHERTDEALDAMEAGLALHDSGEETIRVRKNLQTFKSWRRNKVQKMRVPADERSRLLLEFVSKFHMSYEEAMSVATRMEAFLDEEVGCVPLSRITFGHTR